MPSERIQRQIDRLLDEAEAAFARREWAAVRDCAQDILKLDPENSDALTFLSAAQRGLAIAPAAAFTAEGAEHAETEISASESSVLAGSAGILPAEAGGGAGPQSSALRPQSFASGRYQVVRLLGEGGKKKVYLAHDTLLDRQVAFALIKTKGLDREGLARVTREA